MARFEITGGNGRGALVSEIQTAIKESGGKRVGSRHAFGLSNQPRVVTFSAADESEAKRICNAAADMLWPNDGSCMATLIAFAY